MPILVRTKSAPRRKSARGHRDGKSRTPGITADERALENAVSAAAARDLAGRTSTAEADETALVNAVARAAARSLAS